MPTEPASAPALSVVMPVTGRSSLVAETLASLATQTFRNWELVVPDDTPDEAERGRIAALVDDFAARTRLPCRRIFTGPRLYQSRNTNQGLAAARGRWLRILHSDDLLAPWALANEMAALEKLSPLAEVLFSDPLMFSNGFRPRREHTLAVLSPRHVARVFLHSGTALPSCTVFSRAAYERVGGFDPGYDFLCDWKFFLRLVLDQLRHDRAIVRASAAWVGWRQHADSVTSRGWAVHFREHLRLMDELAAGPELADLVELDAGERERFFEIARRYRHRRLREDIERRPPESTAADLAEVENLLTTDPLAHEAQLALGEERERGPRAGAPIDFGWESAVARALARQGRAEAALLRARALAEVCGDAPEVRALEGGILRLLIARARQSGDADALAALRAQNFDTPLAAAHALAAAADYGAARDAYAALLDLDPDLPGALHGVGYSLLGLGRPADALPFLRRSVAAAPGSVSALADLARALAETGSAAEGIAKLQAALALAPERDDLRLALAQALGTIGRNTEAVAACDEILARDPGHAEALRVRAEATPFAGHYEQWRETRFAYILDRFGADAFHGRTLLELGAGHGILGAKFQALDAQVTCAEARADHVAAGAARFPAQRFVCQNLEEDFRHLGVFDFVLHTGLLYHLHRVERHLRWLHDVTGEWLILETEVADSDDPGFILTIEEQKEAYDQSFVGVGTRPSAAYIERILRSAGFEVERCDDPRINAGFHRYDWPVTNADTRRFGRWEHGLRRFWLCRKLPVPAATPATEPVAELATSCA